MSIPAWLPVLAAIPVLLAGEWLVDRISVLRKFNIPAPVVGGLFVSLVVLGVNLASDSPLQFVTKVTAQWWTWIVTIEPEWIHAPAKGVTLPLMVAFFTCIGLNATWDVVRRGSGQVLLFLAIGTVLAVFQNGIGVGLASVLGVDPLLGLACGAVSMTGGHGTALGFAPVLENHGLQGAAVLGAAAATLGLVMGGLIGGPVGTRLIRRNALKAHASSRTHLEIGATAEAGILQDFRALGGSGLQSLSHLLLLVFCIKVGAWVSHFIQMSGLTFPPQIGAMVLGVIVRNAFDLSGHRWIRSETIDVLASVSLAFFLTIAMMSLNLIELANAALPMLVILLVQVLVVGIFATFATYWVMGRDYDAAIMAAGHCGFALGATPNAVANMKSLVERFGPAPRAFLVIPLVGAALIDFTNSLNITLFLNLVR
ncbi:MAG: sodium:glutamate symporter [Betaproteobacteria bacterium]|nr:sodium:glutamate symporter [Betaproteobacteria bacterium]